MPVQPRPESDLPPDWIEQFTAEGRRYYFNTNTNITTWAHPRHYDALPARPQQFPKLIETILPGEDGSAATLLGDNAQTSVDVMNEPKSGLSANCEERFTSEGQLYYFNHQDMNHNAAKTSAIPASESACERLIRRVFALHELPSLIEAAFSSKAESDEIHSLQGDDAQAFVDVMNEVLDGPDLSPRTRGKCLKLLYRMCSRRSVLPNAMKVLIQYDRTSAALCRGGFGDVWKGEYNGRDVAVKVVRTYSNSDLQKILGRFCKEVVIWRTLQHPNILPLVGVIMSESQFAMVSDWMGYGNINDFVKTHPHANRLGPLADVARGLIYIHDQGMIHGDLKGANVLIDQTGRALLADFGLMTIMSDPANRLPSSSYTQGGTARWMSPELIAPERFKLKNSRPTKPSDCYALGMVIYETISGNMPFHEDTDLTVFMKVMEGKRPPRVGRFAESLWQMLGQCWTPQPSGRPSINDVLQCLEMVSGLPEPLSPGLEEEMEGDDDDWDSEGDSSSVLNGTNDKMAAEWNTTTSPRLSYATNPPLTPVPTAPGVVDVANEADTSSLAATDLNFTSGTGSNDEGAHQDALMVSEATREVEHSSYINVPVQRWVDGTR